MNEGIPNKLNNEHKALITEPLVISQHGIANGKQLNSSITVRKYLFLLLDGKGPLKSIFSHSKGRVAFINLVGSGLLNLGFISAHSGQALQIFLISSVE